MALSTVALLLSQIERRSFAPANQASFTDVEILTIATEEMHSKIIPAILGAREEFYVAKKDLAITVDQQAYTIPDRSFNSVVREVQIIRSSLVEDIPRISLEDARYTSTGYPNAFFVQGDSVMLYPTPSGTQDTLRLHYYLPPGSFVEATDTAVISAINTSTKIVTVTSIPTSWVTGDVFDFVGKSGTHAYKEVDEASTLISGSDITFGTLPSTLAVGDYIMPQGLSSLVQMPDTMIPVLAQYTAAALLNYGGQPGGQEAEDLAVALLGRAIASITPRVTGELEYFQNDWF